MYNKNMNINETTTNEVEALSDILASISASAMALENNSAVNGLTDAAGNLIDSPNSFLPGSFLPGVSINGYNEHTSSQNDILSEIINMITNLQEQVLQISEAVVETQTTILELHNKQMELSLLTDGTRKALNKLTKHILESSNSECKRLIFEYGSDYTILKCSCDELDTKWIISSIGDEAFFEERVKQINAGFEAQEILAAQATEDTEDTPIDLEQFKSPIDQLEP